MQAYLINLARRPDRLRKMTKQLKNLGIPFQRVDALDARLASEAELARQFSDIGPQGIIPKGDKCCSLSHVRAWQAFAESGRSHGLILEDDVALDSQAAPLLRKSDWIPDEVDLLKIEHFGPPSQRVLIDGCIDTEQGRMIGRLRSRHTGAGAYILSRQMAVRLLAFAGPWTLPVDHLLFNPSNSPLVETLRPYQMTPAIARQTSDIGGDTDIEEWRVGLRKMNWRYVRREIVRACYDIRAFPGQMARIMGREARLVTLVDPAPHAH